MSLKTVKVPKRIEPLFKQAEEYVSEYFNKLDLSPSTGQIHINNERYILVRAESLSVHFLEFLINMYPSLKSNEARSASSKVLFDMGHTIGKADAASFNNKSNKTDPIEKLSCGPVHFAHTGWSFVDILESSNPSPDEDFYMLYDHPHSFESDSWLNSDREANFCTCHMNAGYSSGWCTQSFEVEVIAREILCRSKGDKVCRFIMSPPHRLEEHIEAYKKQNKEIFEK
ncbi:MAG: putative hydrocarbon binding protein [Bacteriovoracaceae bacterium]|jgi:predicted hydrocarbon binding protein